MLTLKTLDSSIIAFIILIIIYINSFNRFEKTLLNYKFFIGLIQINMALIIIDILAWAFNGLPGMMNLRYNMLFNVMLYSIAPVAPSLWVAYSNLHIFKDEKRIKKQATILIYLISINAIISIISLFTGWFFSVDMQNIYHRGVYFWIHYTYCYALLGYSLFVILRNRKLVEQRDYYSLLLFFLPQLVGTTIQIMFYGVSYNWVGMMLSLLIIYFNIQNRGLNTDYLTGTYNRRHLDQYIKEKIRNSSKNKSFSAILIDLDKFKLINDKCGHETGDTALKDAVKIIKKSLRQNDFLARYGGDEFVILIDIYSRKMLEQIVSKILSDADDFNIQNQKPYKISFSIGYDIYDYSSKMTSDEFLNHIDLLMYNNKKSKQSTSE